MSFDKISGGIMLLILALILAAAGIALIRADIWWLSALGFPCVAWSCEAAGALWKRIFP